MPALEAQLGLSDQLPQDFDSITLTRENLAKSPATFEDFLEPGDHTPILTKTPRKPVQDHHRSPNFCVGDFQMGDLLVELRCSRD